MFSDSARRRLDKNFSVERPDEILEALLEIGLLNQVRDQIARTPQTNFSLVYPDFASHWILYVHGEQTTMLCFSKLTTPFEVVAKLHDKIIEESGGFKGMRGLDMNTTN